mgnify:CR=1 FL=1
MWICSFWTSDGRLDAEGNPGLFRGSEKLKNEGYAVIIITHRMSEIMAISDRVTILRDGKKVKELATSETNPKELSNVYDRAGAARDFEIQEQSDNGVALELKNVNIMKGEKAILDNINLTVNKGEILGMPA